jgi:hypothetical protein
MQLRRLAQGLLALLLSIAPGVRADEGTAVEPPLPGRAVEAQGGVRSALYLDTDHNTIVTSSTDAGTRVDGRWQLGARYVLDVVSSASIDVTTQATARFDDTRHELGTSAGYRSDDGTSLMAGYSYSTEHDWQSHNPSLSGSLDVLDRNVSLGGSLAYQDNTITRVDTFGYSRKLRSYLATVSASYTLSPSELLHGSLAVSFHDGFQASPYRYVKIDQFGYAENVPEQRTKLALVGRYHRDLGGHTALRLHARGYWDSYQVAAATLGAELAYERDGWELSGFVRGYAQQRAWFFKRLYAEPQQYMTLDKELSTFWDVFAGGAMGRAWRSPDSARELRLEARAAVNHFSFVDYVWLESRQGLTATLALSGRL